MPTGRSVARGRADVEKTDWTNRSRSTFLAPQHPEIGPSDGDDTIIDGEEMETYSPFSASMGQALWVIMLVAGPPLILMLVVGLIISMLQAATSINEQTVSFVPKLLAFILFLAIYGATVGGLLIGYTRDLLMHIPDDIS